MTGQNRQVLTALRASIDAFTRGEISLEDVQSRLQSSLDLLESGNPLVPEAIRIAEGDLEEIRFARLLDEQRPAAVLRLDDLRFLINAELEP